MLIVFGGEINTPTCKQVYCCFTAALLLLYCCFTVKLLLYCKLIVFGGEIKTSNLQAGARSAADTVPHRQSPL
jgi:hypothetical protein